MFVQDIAGILPGQKIKIKYDCDGEFERCGEEWELKLKDAQKNFEKNGGKHICRQCDYDYELWSNKKIKSLDIDITDYADRYICFDGNLK